MTEISLNKVVDVRLRDDDNGDFFLSGSSSKRAVSCGVAADCSLWLPPLTGGTPVNGGSFFQLFGFYLLNYNTPS
jgi:hypothetical protein